MNSRCETLIILILSLVLYIKKYLAYKKGVFYLYLQAPYDSSIAHWKNLMSTKPAVQKPLFLTIIQIFLGLALLSLSTHLALESTLYLEVLNQNGLNQYHTFGLLVCLSFISGVFLIAQQVLTQDQASIDDHFSRAVNY